MESTGILLWLLQIFLKQTFSEAFVNGCLYFLIKSTNSLYGFIYSSVKRQLAALQFLYKNFIKIYLSFRISLIVIILCRKTLKTVLCNFSNLVLVILVICQKNIYIYIYFDGCALRQTQSEDNLFVIKYLAILGDLSYVMCDFKSTFKKKTPIFLLQ